VENQNRNEMFRMTEFTEEQEAEIQRRIQEAKQIEQFRISGDQFYRLSVSHLAALVREGVCDQFVLQVGQALHESFRKANFPQQQPSDQQDQTNADETAE